MCEHPSHLCYRFLRFWILKYHSIWRSFDKSCYFVSSLIDLFHSIPNSPAIKMSSSPRYLSLDVECVADGLSHDDRTVCSAAVVDYDENTMLYELVKPDKPVVSYLTPITGIIDAKRWTNHFAVTLTPFFSRIFQGRPGWREKFVDGDREREKLPRPGSRTHWPKYSVGH